MNILFASLNPCNTRKVNAKQYINYIKNSGHKLVEDPNDANMIFVWGCEFRNDWRVFTHTVLKELKELYPYAEVVYIGCTFTGEFAASLNDSLGIDVIPWKSDTDYIEKKINGYANGLLKKEPMCLAEERLVDDIEEYKRQNKTKRVWFEDEYVKLSICEGCSGYCTFCSEKLMFPKFRSFPEDDIIRQCKEKIENDDKNKVLFLADSCGEYGSDTGSSLPNLIFNIQREISTNIKFGITQMNPEHFLKYEEAFDDLIREGAIEYLNIPIQTTNDKTLKAMRRKYTSKDIERIFDSFNKNSFYNFSTHLLVGFPGEEEFEIEQNIDFLSRYEMRHIIVSAFMNHPAIEASRFGGQISDAEKQLRVEKYKEALSSHGIKIYTDLGGISNRLMNSIRESLGIPLRLYT